MSTKVAPLSDRRAGVLLQPTALPSGCLDNDVERWLETLARGGFRVWQMLPLVIPDHTGSPYQSCSALAIDPSLLATQDHRKPGNRAELDDFIQRQGDWLQDFALYQVLKKRFDGRPWYEWPEPYIRRDPALLTQLAVAENKAIARVMLRQFHLEKRWQTIRRVAAENDIQLFGDVPIFVALDSADVWANQQDFLLGDDHRPTYVAGVPPDYFSDTGQRWGNPHYDWDAMRASGFHWWRSRLRRMFDWFDIIRLDHFRGLEAVWMIPAACETAMDGHWEKTPGAELLTALREDYPDLPIVAEDLGIITPEVTELRHRFALPGMAVLQFAFDHFEDNPHKPANIQPDTVVYTGTHDNDTTNGWYATLDEQQRRLVATTLGVESIADAASKLTETALQSRANLAVIPFQDLLGLGSEARFNKPGTTHGNWRWQFSWDMIPDGYLDNIRAQIKHAGR